MLNFIGCGSAFHTELGNNSAFLKKGRNLFLIDCGSSTFARLKAAGLLHDVDHIDVLMTHTHADHVGSLGDLILYGYWVMGKMAEPAVTVYAPAALKINTLMNMVGAGDETYTLRAFSPHEEIEIPGLALRFKAIPVKHVKELHCFGYVIDLEGKTIYYSGDTCEVPEAVLERLCRGGFDCFYHDTCKADYDGNVHMSLRKLAEIIPPEYRNKVYCMHQDPGFNRAQAEELGFHVVKTVIF